jgi:hypothetical protein
VTRLPGDKDAHVAPYLVARLAAKRELELVHETEIKAAEDIWDRLATQSLAASVQVEEEIRSLREDLMVNRAAHQAEIAELKGMITVLLDRVKMVTKLVGKTPELEKNIGKEKVKPNLSLVQLKVPAVPPFRPASILRRPTPATVPDSQPSSIFLPPPERNPWTWSTAD